ncbi:Monoacylglycerol lipase ABHD12 [Leucoagaricus sp. SymC.cos]|nr:Monoacylglycerol lipase ABHD12 [Leucoagaricus sp. SymC.cos]
MSKNSSVLQRGFSRVILVGLLGLGVSYLLVVALVMIPAVQTYITYAHHIDFFGYNKFDHPEDYGLAPGKTVNMKLQSSDNTTIGAWFIVADSLHRERSLIPPTPNQRLACIPSSLSKRPTILFLHGNTGTRALPIRVTVYTGLTARLDANIFTIDYRGFGDSAGHPTVEGVARDARAAWNYLVLQGAKPQDVLIVGHSLGTAIASLLAADLARDGIEPRGLVLMSAFSSLRTLMDQYYLFGFLPLLKPLSVIPLVPRVLTWSLKHRFDTLTLVPEVKTSVLLIHGENDWDILHTHTSTLFEAFLEQYLPSPPTLCDNPLSSQYAAQNDFRTKRRSATVRLTSISGFGTLEEFVDHKKGGRRVAMLKTMAGGHDIGRLEGVQDAIGRMFDFY